MNAPADVALHHEGITVFHVYKDDDLEQGSLRTYYFSLSEDSREDGDDVYFFDVRDLPRWTQELREQHRLEDDAIRECIRLSIEDGSLCDALEIDPAEFESLKGDDPARCLVAKDADTPCPKLCQRKRGHDGPHACNDVWDMDYTVWS